MKKLNELSGKEWVRLTKSVWYESPRILPKDLGVALDVGVLLSEPHPRGELKKLHPATFSESDVGKLIRFFTKQGEVVLDPFMGIGNAGIATLQNHRRFVGIELYHDWYAIAKKIIGDSVGQNVVSSDYCKLYLGDSLEIMRNSIKTESIDFIVTSPPYWNILKKVDRKGQLTPPLRKGLDP